jgi:hypothetical protein
MTGDLWGHIVAGSPQSRVGYMVLAKHIFSDITLHLGGRLELASTKTAARPAKAPPGPSSTLSILDTPQRPVSMGINQSKDELLQYLGISEAVYSQMAVSCLDHNCIFTT